MIQLKKGDRMNKRNYSLLLIVILVVTAGLTVTTGCGKKDPVDTEAVGTLWEQQILYIGSFVGKMETVKEEEAAIAAIHAFAENLEETGPQFTRWYAEYPPFMERVKKEMEEDNELSNKTMQRTEALAKLIAVGMFSDSVVKMQVRKFGEVEGMKDGLKRLSTAVTACIPDDTLKSDKEAGKQYDKLVMGEMTGSPKVEAFFTKLRNAALTSRLKITMINMQFMGRAIEAFKKAKGYAPKISDLEELKDYENFVPEFSDKLVLDDAWGNYFYYKADGADYWLAGAGSDGKFLGFEQKGFYTQLENSDLIYSNGRFIFAPRMNSKK